jgi:hypothetical protein
MKSRIGFVSNSSSSSYIAAFRDAVPCPHCGRSDPNFLDMLDKSNIYCDDNEVDAIGMENVIAKLTEYYDEGSSAQRITELTELLNPYNKDDFVLAYFSISYHDDSMKQILKNMVEAGSAIMLQGDV